VLIKREPCKHYLRNSPYYLLSVSTYHLASPWRWRQQWPLNCQRHTTTLHTQKSSAWVLITFIIKNIELVWLNSSNCSQFPYTALSALKLLWKHVGEGTCGCTIWIFYQVFQTLWFIKSVLVLHRLIALHLKSIRNISPVQRWTCTKCDPQNYTPTYK
jgi:hypothetical protein